MKTKKLLGVTMAFMLVIASMLTVFAASNQDVLNALEQGLTLSTGKTVYLSAQNMQAAKNYLAQENLSSSQLDAIVSNVKVVQEAAKTCDNLADLRARSDVQAAVNNAAAAAGVKVATDSGKFVVTDSNGKVLLSVNKDSFSETKPSYSSADSNSNGNLGNSTIDSTSTSAIKQTGAEINLANMIIVVSSTIAILAGASFVAFKFKLLKD